MELFNDVEFSPQSVSSTLSKSQFLKGQQCHKRLWLSKHRPGLRREPNHTAEFLFSEGHIVGKLAQQLHPGGIDINEGNPSIPIKLSRTQDALKTHNVIYEAAFQFNHVFAMVDILHQTPFGIDCYEVKSSTTEKAVFLQDMALQQYVVEGAGLSGVRFFLVLINPHYVRKGPINVNELFKQIPVHYKIEALKQHIPAQLQSLRTALKSPNAPSTEIGPHCFSPYDCDYMSHCWAHIPKHSVFEISGMKLDKKFELYNKGIVHLTELFNTPGLNPHQNDQIRAQKHDEPIVNKPGIQAFLNTLFYPLYFLDFEAFQRAIPPFDTLRPYQQVAFQYSLHSQQTPQSELKHTDFIAEPNEDPRYALAQSLIKTLPKNACILTYNSGFEKLVLKQLADTFPKFSKHLMVLHNNIVDLMEPFQRHDVYTKDMEGSFSIKSVLPALVPELSYESLAVRDGQMAVISYIKLSQTSNPIEKETLTSHLREYCKLDTYAMVRVLDVLREMANSEA
jgi:hypothetical protein